MPSNHHLPREGGIYMPSSRATCRPLLAPPTSRPWRQSGRCTSGHAARAARRANEGAGPRAPSCLAAPLGLRAHRPGGPLPHDPPAIRPPAPPAPRQAKCKCPDSPWFGPAVAAPAPVHVPVGAIRQAHRPRRCRFMCDLGLSRALACVLVCTKQLAKNKLPLQWQ